MTSSKWHGCINASSKSLEAKKWSQGTTRLLCNGKKVHFQEDRTITSTCTLTTKSQILAGQTDRTVSPPMAVGDINSLEKCTENPYGSTRKQDYLHKIIIQLDLTAPEYPAIRGHILVKSRQDILQGMISWATNNFNPFEDTEIIEIIGVSACLKSLGSSSACRRGSGMCALVKSLTFTLARRRFGVSAHGK